MATRSLVEVCSIDLVEITTETGRLGWVASQNCGRNTAAIIYSCLVTIILCIWTSLHIGVQDMDSTQWQIRLAHTRWVLLAVIAPESVASFAIGECYQAYILQKHLQVHKGWKWPLDFCFLASTGGLFMQSQDRLVRLQRCKDFDDCGEDFIADVPKRYEKVLEDKKKAGWFMKLVTLAQILWFAVQVLGRYQQIGRRSRNTTTLEIMTAGFILCGFIQYIFWWNKPQGVLFPIMVNREGLFYTSLPHEEHPGSSRGTISEPNRELKPNVGLQGRNSRNVVAKQGSEKGHHSVEGKPLNTLGRMMKRLLIMYELDNPGRSQQFQLFILSTISTGCFAALSFAAWNFDFPTKAEEIIWKISAICMLILPICFASMSFFWKPDKWTAKGAIYAPMAFGLVGLTYGVVRAYVIVESFIGLRSEPMEVYCDVDWPSYLPHVGF